MPDSSRPSLHLLDAHEVVALLREGTVTTADLLDVVEARLAATESAVHATPIVCLERARARAAKLVHPADPPPGYLYGLPVLIKDTMEVEGVLCTEGSPLQAEFIATGSHPLVLQLEAHGAVVVGKTNVPEFAAGSQTFNPLFPTTVSPWDTRTTAGGSSGGSAAALASCQCWLATGSDLGGSLRTPAAFCGVVGFRVSPGRVPRGNATPSGPLRGLHSTNGPMGRCVRDVGLFLDAMAGSSGWDFAPPALPAGQTWEGTAIAGAAARGAVWRAGFSLLGCAFDAAVEALCRAAADTLAGRSAAGAPLPEIGADRIDFAMAQRAFLVLRGESFATEFEEDLADPERARLIKPEIHWNAGIGMVPEAAAMADAARADVAALAEQVEALFQQLDVLCTPATLEAGFDATVRYPTEQVGQVFTNYLGWMVPACIVTVMLCPALVLPCGFLPDGRPVGVQLVGPPGGDAAVLSAAAALEASLGLPRSCPEPRRGSAPLATIGPRTAEEAAKHHQGEVQRFIARYSNPSGGV